MNNKFQIIRLVLKMVSNLHKLMRFNQMNNKFSLLKINKIITLLIQINKKKKMEIIIMEKTFKINNKKQITNQHK